ncbi:MAG: T4 RnlA family RNA ligase [Acetobacter sp.]|nr:T4 RnlA family RNA ligase [Acetobacter sp.]
MQQESLLEKLDKEVECKMLRRSFNRDERLAIYAYTPNCEAADEWTSIQRAARGLVVNSRGEIIIHCVPKFFNLDTPHGVTQKELEDLANKNYKIVYTEKNDGYLIQVKNDSYYGLIVTSKGSFDSQYANFAREYLQGVDLPQDITFICELLHTFPGDESIIVTKHEGTRLVVWEVLNEDGNTILEDYYEERRKLPAKMELTRRFTYKEYLEYMKREDVEGVVMMVPDLDNGNGFNTHTCLRVKHKTPIFFLKHQMISQCTKKAAYKYFAAEQDLNEIDLPDEFRPQMEEWTQELHRLYNDFLADIVKWEVTLQDLTQKGLWLNTSLGLSHRQKAGITYARLNQMSKLRDVCMSHVKEKFLPKEDDYVSE